MDIFFLFVRDDRRALYKCFLYIIIYIIIEIDISREIYIYGIKDKLIYYSLVISIFHYDKA